MCLYISIYVIIHKIILYIIIAYLVHICVAHLGCYNKVPQAEWFRNNRHLFFQFWRVRFQHLLADLVSAESLIPGSQTDMFLLCPHTEEGVRELSGVSFIRALVSCPHDLITSKYHHIGD